MDDNEVGECNSPPPIEAWAIALDVIDKYRCFNNGKYPSNLHQTTISSELQMYIPPKYNKNTGMRDFIVDKALPEILRYQGCELNFISTVIGATAAQEITKIVTEQFIPMNNVFIYDGIFGQITTYSSCKTDS